MLFVKLEKLENNKQRFPLNFLKLTILQTLIRIAALPCATPEQKDVLLAILPAMSLINYAYFS